MIPTTRLIFWTGLIVLPFAAAAPGVPGALPVAVVLISAFAILVTLDALWSRQRLSAIKVTLPEFVRLQKDHAGTFDVSIEHTPHDQLLRVGLALPEPFARGEEERTVQLHAATTHSRFAWHCESSRRGRYVIDRVFVEVASPLGVWGARGRRPASCEVRVYPNLFDERRQVAAIFLRRAQIGVHTQRVAGQGREFEKLRNYLPGDPLGDIHWKASAKRGDLVTRVHQIERTHEVYVAIDASRLSARTLSGGEGDGRAPMVALERYVAATLVLALAAEQQGDQFGVITFSDRVLSCVRARSGAAHFDACRDALYTLQPRKVSPDFEELFTFIRLRLRKRALLVVLTALDDPVLASSFASSCEIVARQHLMLVNLLQPAEVRPLFTQEEDVANPHDVYRNLAGHLRWHKLRELQKVLQRRGVRLSLLDPAQLSAQMIAQHAEVRARQLV
jgi:uncharacterized protein (DUF58 family)